MYGMADSKSRLEADFSLLGLGLALHAECSVLALALALEG